MKEMIKPPIDYEFIKVPLKRYYDYYKAIKKRGKIPKKMVPLEVEIEVTNACNMKCKMCHKWEWYLKNRDKDTTLSKKKIMEILGELSSIGVKSVLFSGGEPLLRNDICELIDYANKLGLKGTVVTNGTLLTKEIARCILKNDWQIAFSIDGSNSKIHDNIRGVGGSFDRVIKAIEIAKNERDKLGKGHIRGHFVIQNENISDIDNFTKMSKKWGLEIITADIAVEKKKRLKDEDIELLKYQILRQLEGREEIDQPNLIGGSWNWAKDFVLGAIDNNDVKNGKAYRGVFNKDSCICFSCDFALITAFGDVYPCCYLWSIGESNNSLGNVKEKSFTEIWFGSKYNKFRNKTVPVKEAKYFLKRCGECERCFFFKEIEKRIGLWRHRNSESSLIKRPAVLNINSSCNNNCQFCNKERELSTSSIKKLLEMNKSVYKDTLLINGREPTIREDFFELVKYANKIGFKNITLRSNGRMFSYENFCHKAIKCGIINFEIYLFSYNEYSHDSITKTPGSFRQTLKGIENLVKLNANVRVKMLDINNNEIIGEMLISTEKTLRIIRKLNITFEELKEERIKEWIMGGKPGPLSIVLFPTNRCNLNCLYCWTREGKKDYEEIPTDEYERIIEEASQIGVKWWTIEGGGEPLCRKETTIKIAEKIREGGMNGVLVTNGTLFTEDDARKLVELSWENVVFSVDGSDEVQDEVRGRSGTLDNIRNAINLIKKYKKEYGISRPNLTFQSVLTKRNYSKLKELVLLAAGLSITSIQIINLGLDNSFARDFLIPKEKIDDAKKHLQEAGLMANSLGINMNVDELLFDNAVEHNSDMDKLIKRRITGKPEGILYSPCFEPWFQMVIDPNGKIGVCCISDFELGNIRNKSLKDVWFGPHLKKFREEHKNKIIRRYCKRCDISFYYRTEKIRNKFLDDVSKITVDTF